MRAWILWLCWAAVLVGTQVMGATPRQNKGATQSTREKAGAPAETERASEKQPASKEETAATKLPVRRVVLYKGGVGYFEHLGEVHGDQNMRIDFTSSQLNDVLQSLTVLDLNGGRITGIDYDSEAPFSQRLGHWVCRWEQTRIFQSFWRRCEERVWRFAAATRKLPGGC